MLKRYYIGIFLIAFSVLYTNLRSGIYFAYYLIDTEDFIENFCQNKNKPELHCEGKCKLSDVSAQSQKKIDVSFEDFLTNFVWISSHQIKYPIFITLPNYEHRFYYKKSFFQKVYFSIFHPPKWV